MNLLETIIKQFTYYKQLGEKAIAQIDDKHLHSVPNTVSNSIAIVIKHLHGNMLSRWTDFLTSDGEKTWRQRDAEFENEILNKTDLLKLWDAGWNCMLDTIKSLTEDDLNKIIYIRNQGCTVMDAILRQLAHYPYHVGQIVYIARYYSGDDWTSLSIPKGASEQYNKEKFEQEKSMQHFTDEYLNQK